MNHDSAAAKPHSLPAGEARDHHDLAREVSEARGEFRTLKWASALASQGQAGDEARSSRNEALDPSFETAFGAVLGARASSPRAVHAGETPSPWHSRGYLPHFEGGEIVQSITFRLHDSLPVALRDELAAEPERVTENERKLHHRRRIEVALDHGHGACYLENPHIARMVSDALWHFDGERYRLHAWCVMPNHVHVVVTPLAGRTLSSIVHSWKSFTATEANQHLGRRGSFWMQEYFDRAIRDEHHFRTAVEYVEHNPVNAGLCEAPEDWPWSSLGARVSGARDASDP